MTAPKKSTSKSAKSPAPATKSVAKPTASKSAPAKAAAVSVSPVAPAKKAVAKKTVAPAQAKTPAAAAAAVRAPAKSVVAELAPTPVVRPVVSQPVATVIQARIDIGFGNVLHIRGEGAGLSWDEGQRMDCIADDLWQVTLPESSRGIVFKFLVNDLTWSTGPDYSVTGGASITLTPEF